MKLVVIVPTMHQDSLDIYEKMNLQTDAVIANQCDINGYLEEKRNGKLVKMVSTNTRGLSRNRNIALAHAAQESDLILFADDDMILCDGYETIITDLFEKHPEADAIKFNMHDLSTTRKLDMKPIQKWEKASRKSMSCGVCALAIKQNVLRKTGLSFHENFGSGTINYCGEDTIFNQALINKRVAVYRSPIDIAGIDQTESTWFKGCDEHFCEVSGMVFATIYPKLASLLALRSAFKRAKNHDCKGLGFWQILRCYLRGVKKVKHGQ